MKKLLPIVFLLASMSVAAQESHIYADGEYAIKAYDVVAYFIDKPTKGNKEKYSYRYNGVLFAFSTQENLARFRENPENYIPQYGGHCSYAMATLGKKVSPDPEVFEIRDGKLYLFHRARGLKNWLAADTRELQRQADLNWQKLTSN